MKVLPLNDWSQLLVNTGMSTYWFFLEPGKDREIQNIRNNIFSNQSTTTKIEIAHDLNLSVSVVWRLRYWLVV